MPRLSVTESDGDFEYDPGQFLPSLSFVVGGGYPRSGVACAPRGSRHHRHRRLLHATRQFAARCRRRVESHPSCPSCHSAHLSGYRHLARYLPGRCGRTSHRRLGDTSINMLKIYINIFCTICSYFFLFFNLFHK